MKSEPSPILKSLLRATGFFATCGEELKKIFDFDMAKIYIFLIAGLIFYWFFRIKRRFVIPGYLSLFLMFVFIHTLITYGLIFRSEFTFADPRFYTLSNPDPHVLGVNYEQPESVGISVLRQFLFILSCYAFCAALQTKKLLLDFVLAYSVGLSIVIFISLSSFDISVGDRVSGGVADPNAFGFSGAMLAFLATIFIRDSEVSFLQKLFLSFSLILGIAVVFLSASRGAILCVGVGFLASLCTSKISFEKIVLLIFTCVIAIVLLAIVSSQVKIGGTLIDQDRYSLNGALADHGAGRTDIWHDYLQPVAVKKFLITGVGFGRTVEAIRETYTYELKVTHNNYLGILVNYGIVGFILFCAAVVQIWNIIQVPTIHGLFVMWLISGFFLDTFAIRETWIILAIVCCCVAQRPWLEPGYGDSRLHKS